MYMQKRSVVHNFYNDSLAELDWLDLPAPMPEDCTTSYYFYHIQTKNGMRNQLAKFLRENDIYTTYRYYPLHRVVGYGVTGKFENADYAADNTLWLPLHQSLSWDDMEKVVSRTGSSIRSFADVF